MLKKLLVKSEVNPYKQLSIMGVIVFSKGKHPALFQI